MNKIYRRIVISIALISALLLQPMEIMAHEYLGNAETTDNVSTYIEKESTNLYSAIHNEVESNDSYEKANLINVGDSVTGSIGTSIDYDYYKITTPSNGKLTISFDHDFEYKESKWKVVIYKFVNGNYYEINDLEISLNENVTIPFIGATAGAQYFVKVFAWNIGVTGYNYTIGSSIEASDYYEKEFNDSYSTATEINNNTKYTGVINSSGDYDYYMITAPSNGKLTISFDHDFEYKESKWKVVIYKFVNGNYYEINDLEISLNENVTIPFIGATAGAQYFVKVFAWNIGVTGYNYTIGSSIEASDYYEKEFNDSYSTATEINNNTKYTGVINSSGDYDYYKCIPTVTGVADIVFSHNFINSDKAWKVTAYLFENGQYKELVDEYVYLNYKDNVSIASFGVKKGKTYFIQVQQYNTAVVEREYVINFKVSPKPSSSLKVKKSGKKATISWKKVSGVKGYELYMKVGSGKYKKIKTTNKTKYVYTKMKKGKKYSFKVRSYVIINGKKFYSKYSNVKSVKR